MTSLLQIVLMLIHVAKWIVLAHVIMSWLINFNVLNLRQPLVWQLWNGLNRVLEPVYSRIRRILPPTAGIDFAPLAALLAVFAAEIVISNNLYAFG
ncbi:YggT family protein [Tabrizicola oligotrophica]|uniref:YggT family protein n=1 Tax=Tabrizicola oligotrophica TaxID=2710650 RepID=A0A6M0QQP4_9RHOB|nr:YggT family protein [Tabrizicola oligotrophica]NEY89656.1 YggT family protein [Tabrizicola oligotrophica]